jgi:hypothetical protein
VLTAIKEKRQQQVRIESHGEVSHMQGLHEQTRARRISLPASGYGIGWERAPIDLALNSFEAHKRYIEVTIAPARLIAKRERAARLREDEVTQVDVLSQ